MDEYESADVERDPRFPTGPWAGFFLQHWLPGRHPTHLHMTCRGGRLTGTGRDAVGAYTIDGTYDLATGRCEWAKQYVRKHSVVYRGVNDGRGIWGVWEIRLFGGLYLDRGGFHLWPEGEDDPTGRKLHAEHELPAPPKRKVKWETVEEPAAP